MMEKYDFQQVTIVPWPWSQYCMNCKHGEFMQSETFNSSNYICFVNGYMDSHIQCEFFEEQGDNNEN